MKNSNDTSGNRTRDLPACSAMLQPTAPPAWNRRKNTLGVQLQLKDLQQYICMFIVTETILGLHFLLSKDYSHTSLCLNSLVIIFDSLSKRCLTYRPNELYVTVNIDVIRSKSHLITKCDRI